MTTWHIPPEDQGQHVERAWAAAGEAGAVLRIRPRWNRGYTTYRLHRWRKGGDELWSPWNQCPITTGSVTRRGRTITEREAERLLD